ncbi:hypothetical protein B0H15DRAFT_954109 [Mycena belliarum]|uniref:Uncharacterized protein n=1 Tax=Mycena belliarum TaxID=1033014 RepID=A0AAD6TVV8_9AGAR|nr:hypothetical protein B0H15DRAFT_954106 [Mycena belliae]KAJ7079249.1 hypothetical protein B0H15DRAFT_954109 [Mycena belliae]
MHLMRQRAHVALSHRGRAFPDAPDAHSQLISRRDDVWVSAERSPFPFLDAPDAPSRPTSPGSDSAQPLPDAPDAPLGYFRAETTYRCLPTNRAFGTRLIPRRATSCFLFGMRLMRCLG